MLQVHRAERSDRLVAALGEILAQPLPDPLATEVVAVHSRGIERWISQELALRLGAGALGTDGVAANIDFPFPGRLIRESVATASGVDPERDPWLPQRLTWPLLQLVDEARDAAMLGPLRALVGGDASGDPEDPSRASRRFGAVRHVADLFDRYGVHRPEMVTAWLNRHDTDPHGRELPERHRWQPALWRAVRQQVDVASFAERHEAAIAALRRDATLLDLPERLALFGLTALPASYLDVLDAIAVHRDVHLLLLHPSPDLWRRVAEEGRQLWRRDQDPTSELPRNPLLRSWGRDVRELQLVAPLPDDTSQLHHHPAADAPPPTTLLARIQADVHADRARGLPAADEDDRPLLDPDDQSVQVHDCHGRLRQVEVVRDAILHLLAERPDLELRDIIVMCPDIEAFAPLVTAVFGAEAVVRDDAATAAEPGTPPALRVRLADRSLRRTNPVIDVVSVLLGLVEGRVTASAVLDLVSRQPVRRRFRFDDDDLELLESWITELQIRWGIDADDRRRQGLPALDANSWRAGLERLQLGMAMADEQLRMFSDVVPYDGVEGRTNALAGRLVELVTRLDRALDTMRAPRTIDGWRDAVGAAADALTSTDREHDWQRLQLHRVLQDLVDEATDADGQVSRVALTLGEARTLLEERLGGRPTTTGHRTGDLTVCTLVPMRSVPHKVVCLLGLDDGAFPRQAVPDGDDVLLLAPRVGDRDPRSEDRQLLLDALLAAEETLVVTYAGRDVRTNEDRPPAVPVDELLDVVDRTVRTPDGRPARQHVVTRHPLQTHDPRNFTPGALHAAGDRPWSFDPAMLTAARTSRREPHPPRPFLAAELDLPDEDVIDLDDLVAFLEHPVKAFVRQRLELFLPTGEDEPSDAIPASLAGLDAWRVGDEMLQAWRAGGALDRAQRVACARGLVPPGDLGTEDLHRVRDRVDRIVALCGEVGIEQGATRTVDLELTLPDGRLLTGSVPGVARNGWQLETVGYSKIKPKHRLAAWARLVALAAYDPTSPWSAATVGRHPFSSPNWKDAAQAALLPTFGGSEQDVRATATTHLQRLIDLYDRGRRAPLPLYCASSAKVAENFQRDTHPIRYVDKEWETDRYRGIEREDVDPYHLLVLGGQVPTEALFAEVCHDAEERSWATDDRRVVAYAWRLWEPILAAERRRNKKASR